MAAPRRIALLVCMATIAVAMVFAAYLFAAKKAREDYRYAAERQLQIIALDLESTLEKYETLPYSVAYLPLTSQLLSSPADAALARTLNATLKDIQLHAKVAAIYLMDSKGLTVAASNWDAQQTFMDQNFNFRPYFTEAIKGNAGRFYAIGNTTSIPGYFIAQPVYPAGAQRGSTAPIGVIAVKISLNEFAQAWRSSEEAIALADRQGVVFLSNRNAWQYHSLHALDVVVQQNIANTLQYVGNRITPILDLPKPERQGFGEYVARPIGRLGWQLMLFPSEAKAVRAGVQAAVLCFLVLIVLAAFIGVYDQRRRRLQEGMAAQFALKQAALELDRKIAERTDQLMSANQQLALKYDKLKETESLLRSTQNELVQAGKLAMLGQMAAGITHELNQPLTAIRAFADNAGTFLSQGKLAQAADNLRHISHASARMGQIVGQLKGFARKSPQAVSAVDVGGAIHAAVRLLHSEFERQAVQLELQLDDALFVPGDPVRLEQVLLNLLRNALDAVENSALKKISIRLTAEDNRVNISILDTGPGLQDEAVQHLFEPFFTTKPSGKGLGLGLAISSSIVQAMNGGLSARNIAGGGAEFVIEIPLSAAGRTDQ
ncbi:ATP-binding protein [Undibacterium sp.]|uniref:ATP-binding protein n=1 Tax=Undibacterium sp. TaxID=1914977 RepID=UPI002B9C91D1|nr:ATP-binding protein [Undibacterium sp.]HTD05957.1 ATP-binding protein [Undibacterium sp.]